MTDLYRLLPAIYRLRDGETGEPLRALLEAIGREYAVVADDIDQLFDDLFVETADPALIPNIGDLVGYLPLTQPAGMEALIRAEVAQTVALRRRKGTLAAIEATARNTTGLPAVAREYFRELARTQYMNRPLPGSPALVDCRDEPTLAEAGSAFDRLPYFVDVRRIASGRGRHNISNVGVFIWPVRAFSSTFSPAVAVDAQRYRFSPLGHDLPLFNRPAAERSIGSLAGPLNVPRPISRRALTDDLASAQPRLYGAAPDGPPIGFSIFLDGDPVPITDIRCCRLDDEAGSWLNLPASGVTVDPVLGRLAIPAPSGGANPPEVRVTFHYGFTAAIGGGEYPRSLAPPLGGAPLVRVPADQPNLAAALAAVAGNGIIELSGSDRHPGPANIDVAAGGSLTIRSAEGSRAVLDLAQPMEVRGGFGSGFTLDRLLLIGAAVSAPANNSTLSELAIRDSTLVPGLALGADGAPLSPGAPSVEVALPLVGLSLERAISGPIRLHRDSTSAAVDSIIDATDLDATAISAAGGGPSGAISLDGVTVIGRIHAVAVGLITDCLILAEGDAAADPPASVHILRRQEGCIRYSWLPPDARTPRRFRCLPDADGSPFPATRSLRFGTPAYARLDGRASPVLLTASSVRGEPGAFGHLGLSRLKANLAIRLAEQVPAGAECGVIEIIEGTDP